MARPEGTTQAPGQVRDPLAATPVAAPGVEAHRDGASLTQLRRARPHRNGAAGLLGRLFGFSGYARIALDERGSAFWKQVDGRRDLHAIERGLRERFGLAREESERAVVEFTKALMLRGLVCLRLPDRGDGQSGREHG
jgi:hypothetical protein